MRVLLSALVLSVVSVVARADAPVGDLLHDDYTEAKHEIRKAMRGSWAIDSGVASVTQEEALYKKYQNHGPIMVYEIPHDDASAEVTFKPDGCKMVVFTMDAKAGGHAFRVKLSPNVAGSVVTFIKELGKEKATQVVLDKSLPKLKNGEWTTLKVKVVGDKGTVMIGDRKVEVQHEKIDQVKKIAKLGFSFGSLQIKQFDLGAVK